MINRILPNSFKTSVLAGTLLLSAVSCGRGALHQIDNDNHSITEAVDKFAKSGSNNVDTQGLELYMVDTIDISSKDFENLPELNNRIKTRAKSYNPQILIKDKWEYGYAIGPRQTLSGIKSKGGLNYHRVAEYAGKYIDSLIVAKAQNKVFANEKESKFYIPVEYYGKPDTTVVELKK